MDVSSSILRRLRRTSAMDVRVNRQSIQELSHDGKSIGSDEGGSPSYDRLGALGVFFGDELGKFTGDELPTSIRSDSGYSESY
jgi:hypothetical protein